MNQEDVDRIIAEAVAESKKESRKKWHKGKSSSNNIETARKVVIYFALPEQRVLFFSIGFGAVALKLIEFYLRFMF